MPGTLTFLVDDNLKAIVAHAAAATEHRPTFSEMMNPALRKDGKEPTGFNTRESDVDASRIPASLWLVKDEGIYLMSSGSPMLLRNGINGQVAYAIEADPTTEADWYHSARSIMGGDDCVEKLDLEPFVNGIAQGFGRVIIKVTEESLDLEVVK